MHSELMITQLDWKEKRYIVSALFEDQTIAELHCEPLEGAGILNNIYVGKVQNVARNIEAAFVEIGGGVVCYYSLIENRLPFFTRQKKKDRISPGDELLVQVCKEGVKTKAPVATSNLSFAGKYAVLTRGNTSIGISGKLDPGARERLKRFARAWKNEEYGLIIRTNAASVPEDQIAEEIRQLAEQYEAVKQKGLSRTCHSLVYEAPRLYLTDMKNVFSNALRRIVTDDPRIFETARDYLALHDQENLGKLSFYEDPLQPFHKHLRLEEYIAKALRERVWLKCGAYLVIQYTEALTVIDVNSGKFEGKKNQREAFLKINLEAAREIARQLRLRNLSGICIVDFIDMEEPEDQELLMETLAGCLRADPVPAKLVDMTALHLVEITRKKIRRPLHEQLGESLQQYDLE